MRLRIFLLLCCLAMIADRPALAVQLPQDVQELEELHALTDAEGKPPARPQPKPLFSLKTNLHPPLGPLRCAGIDPWQNVYAQPDGNSKVVGRTQPEIAVSDVPVNGFQPIVFYNGRRAYVPLDQVHEFGEPGNPDTTCVVVGLDDDNRPIFDYQPKKALP